MEKAGKVYNFSVAFVVFDIELHSTPMKIERSRSFFELGQMLFVNCLSTFSNDFSKTKLVSIKFHMHHLGKEGKKIYTFGSGHMGVGQVVRWCWVGVVWTFLLTSILSPLSPSLWETARYRLKYCLRGPLNPKPTNQHQVT